MKSIRILALFAAIFAIALAFLSFVASPAFSQTVPAAGSLVVIPPAPAAPFYATAEFWSGVIALFTGALAIWKNNQASTHAKINESLVLAIEQATKIPEVAAFESRIKQTIQAKATEYGVQPVLHRIVQDLTEPAAQPPAQS